MTRETSQRIGVYPKHAGTPYFILGTTWFPKTARSNHQAQLSISPKST